MRLLLFGTSGCHLCDLAEALIEESIGNDPRILIETIDIAESEQWQKPYAQLIPVLFHPETQQELRWPFELHQIKQFITGLNHD